MADAIVCECAYCGNVLRRPKYNQYCSRKCYWDGRKSESSRHCEQCGILYTPIRFRRNARGVVRVIASESVTCSDSCCSALSSIKIAAMTGRRKGNWKGGVSANHNHGYRGTNWPAVAESIRARDKWKCVYCGESNDDHKERYGKSLDVHHCIPFHNFTDHRKANHPSNLVSLCIPCHRSAESKIEAVQMTLPLSGIRRGNRYGFARGVNHGQAKLNDAMVVAMRAKRAVGVSVYRIAKDFGVAYMTAKSAIYGETWVHLPMN